MVAMLDAHAARQGMAHDFINEDVAQENATQIAAKLADEEDEG
jgi:hypothetical protein